MVEMVMVMSAQVLSSSGEEETPGPHYRGHGWSGEDSW